MTSADENPGVFTDEQHPKGYLVKPGDIVVGMDGEFRAHLWGGVESWLNQRVCVFRPKIGFWRPLSFTVLFDRWQKLKLQKRQLQ